MGKQGRRWWWLGLPALLVVFVLFRLDSNGFATTPVTLPESTTQPPPPEMVLAPGGFGPVAFGQSSEAVVTEISELLGAPVEDIDQPCRDDAGRWIRWGNLSALAREATFVGFIAGIYYRQDAPAIGVTTAEGLTLGMTGRELQDLYGDRVDFSEPVEGFEDSEVRSFGIDGYVLGHSTEGLGGYLEGDLEDGTVITIVGGDLCSFPPGS